MTIEHAKYIHHLCVGAIGNIIGLWGMITDTLRDEVGFVRAKAISESMRKVFIMWQRLSSCMCFETRFLDLWSD